MSVYSNLVIADGASNYWRLNEPSGTTAVDVIGGANGTISGGVTLNQPGALSDGDKAMTFDGVDDKIRTTVNVAIPLLCTIEAWVKISSTAPDFSSFLNTRTATGTGEGIQVGTHLNCLYVYSPTIGGFSSRIVADGQWHHAVCVLLGPSGVAFYVDGVFDKTDPVMVRTTPGNRPVVLGHDDTTGTWPGSLDDVAIYPVALSAAQIAAHYTVGKIGKTAPTTYADRVILDGASNYWRLNEPSGTTAVDIIGGKNGTISGGVTLNQAGALSDGDKAMTFDGATGKIETAGNVSIQVASTIEYWVKTTFTTQQPAFSNRGAAGSVAFAGTTAPGIAFLFLNVGGATTGVKRIDDNLWHHIIFTILGTQVKCYIDGILDKVQDILPPSIGTNIARIGWDVESVSQYFNGSLDDVAIYPVALTPAQIAAHYTVGKIGKTAPTTYADRVILDGAANYWRLNEPSGTTAVDIIGGKNGTISGGVTLNQQGALGDGDPSMAFNGTTGKIQTVASVLIPLIVSIELWFKVSATGERDLFSTRGLSTGSTVVCYIDATTSVLGFFSDQGGGGFRVVRDGQWHHAVYVLDGVNCAVYTDGTLDRQFGSTRATPSTGPAAFGWDQLNPQFLNGSLDDVAIYPVALTPAQIAAHYQARLLSGSRRPLPAFVLAHRRFPS